ncbi:MAG: EF-hand domain-containing protein [Syntrophales bacterium]|nr:EF-hand domain-containing protein [Syntrophales bacterium]
MLKAIKVVMAGMIVILAMSGIVWGADTALGTLDKNKDGRLDMKELDEEAQSIFRQHDRNRDGYLDRGEFEAVKGAHSPFTSLDTTRDGRIDPAELKKAAERRFKECDTNNDGYLDEAELNACMQKTAKEGSAAIVLDRDKKIRLLDRSQAISGSENDLRGDEERKAETSPRYKPDVAPLFSIFF